MSFKEKVLDIVRSIPEGQTLSYSKVAEMSGSKGASRAVGTIMKNNYDPTVPCHRVIKSNGKAGDYNRGGEKVKEDLLELEKCKADVKYFADKYCKTL